MKKRRDFPTPIVKSGWQTLKRSVMLLLTIVVCMCVQTVNAQKVTLNLKNVTVQQALQAVAKQTGKNLAYSNQVVDLSSKVSIKIANGELDYVLDKLTANTSIGYELKNDKIYLFEKKAETPAKKSKNPLKKISGKVTDDNGEPIIGATILVEGTSNGTATDVEGDYSLLASPGNTILISYVGYQRKDFKVGNESVYDVTLTEDNKLLNEVVVIGYGSQKKVNLTGAVAQVTSEVFEGRPSANITQMLEGVVPNLNISLSDGKPGRSADFNVRGTGSINGGSALVLIDGVEGDPSMLNPNDVESVSVLKDAAASAIYGARAPFGVVLITTKNAKEGKPQVTYSSSYSLQQPQNVPDLVSDGYIYAEKFAEAYYNYNHSYPSAINKSQKFSTAWLEEYKRRHDAGDFGTVISDGTIGTKGSYVYYPEGSNFYEDMYKSNVFSMTQNLSISGTDNKFDYYLSGRFYYYDGLFDSKEQTDKYKSYNLRFKAGYKVFPWLKVNNNFDYSFNDYYNPITYSEGSGVVWRNIADEQHPSSPMFNPDGTLTMSGAYGLGDLLYGRSGIKTKNEVFKETLSFTTSFFNNTFRINGDFTYKKTINERTKKQVRSPYSTAVDDDNVSITQYISGIYSNFDETTERTNYLATNIYAEYENTFVDKHYVKAMAGWNYENATYKKLYAYNEDLLTDDVENINLTMGTDNKKIESSWWAYHFGGAFFRLNYSFDNRYLVEFNGRYDGSSRFPENNRWAFFPSVSAGWRITEEPWFTVSPGIISNAKLRLSYGSLGNAVGLDNYQYKQTLGVSQSSHVLNGLRPNYMSAPGALPNSLSWEKSTTYNGGLDLGFFNNRLTASADYYIRKTTGMIVAGPSVPDVFGASSPKGNYADMSTYGYELSIEWNDSFSLAGKPFSYTVKASLADYYSVIDKYNNATKSLSTSADQSKAGNYYEGMRIGEIWGYVSNGLWQNQADIDIAEAKAQENGQKYYNPLMQTDKNYKLYPGDVKFEDLNGNGYIDRGKNTVDDPGDRKIIGNSAPRYIYSFTLAANWNNIWVNAFFQGVGKQDWYPSDDCSLFWGQYNRPYNQIPTWQLGNYWTEDNPNAFLPRYTGYYAPLYKGTSNANTRYMMDASYLRLKNLQVGYNLPQAWVSKIHLSKVSIYLSAENLFTWSPMYKWSKDINVSNIGSSDKDLSSSRGDAFNYPMMRSYTIGLNVTF